MVKPEELVLKFGHKIIEHLGVKLYQNKPTNVIAELISNSWDADAEKVFINISYPSYISVADTGSGMTSENLKDSYLVIGKNKRLDKERSTIKQRLPMGRKGIGKLAPFGIANIVDVITIHDSEPKKISWIRLDLTEIQKIENNEDIQKYNPLIIFIDEPAPNFNNIDEKIDRLMIPKVKSFYENNGHGTLILMTDLNMRKTLDVESLKKSIGTRFTVTLLRDDFKVYINDDNNELKEEDALPKFAYKIGSYDKPIKENISICSKYQEIKYWVGFIEKAEHSSDEAGIGIYANGKLAQDRPFTFKLKGGEIKTRYIYGVIEADWLDTNDKEEVISTDRTSINWETQETEEFHEWGQEKLKSWLKEFDDYKKRSKEEIKKKYFNDYLKDCSSHLTDTEQETLIELYYNVAEKISDPISLKSAAETLTQCWTHYPMRKLVHDIWDKFKETNLVDQENLFIETIQKLNNNLVPESLSVAVNVSLRIYALTKLQSQTYRNNEESQQVLLEKFPWILSPNHEKKYCNQQLKTIVLNEVKAGKIQELPFNEKDKPDFVFFQDENEILVVELKHPLLPVSIDHEAQLSNYLNFLRKTKGNYRLSGVLIGGQDADTYDCSDKRIKAKSWGTICKESSAMHLGDLRSMLIGANIQETDARVEQIQEFSGINITNLLQRFYDNDSEIEKTIDNVEQKAEVRNSDRLLKKKNNPTK